jgi:hypothetical protein
MDNFCGDIVSEIELIRSTEEEKGPQISNVRNWQKSRNALAPDGEKGTDAIKRPFHTRRSWAALAGERRRLG